MSVKEGWQVAMRFCSIKLVFIESTPIALSRGVNPLHTKHSNNDAPGVRVMALVRQSLQNVCKQFNVFGALGDDLSDVNELAHISQVRKLSLIFDTNRSLLDIFL